MDAPKRELVACLVTTLPEGSARKGGSRFRALNPHIPALGDWLAAHVVIHMATESAGVYGKPIWDLLEDQFDLLPVNSHHVKAGPDICD